MISYWHKQLFTSSKTKPSSEFLRVDFLPLGKGPHPMWLSCGDSSSAVEAATLQAKIMSGKYKDDKYVSHYETNSNGACALCSHFPGDFVHLLSGHCPPLYRALSSTLNQSFCVLSDVPFLIPPVLAALQRDSVGWTAFLLDPSTDPEVIPIAQEMGNQSIWPLFKFSRAYIWSMHHETYM